MHICYSAEQGRKSNVNVTVAAGQIYNERLFEQFLLKHASMFPAPGAYERRLNEQESPPTVPLEHLRPNPGC